jgi:predicted aminopeptidase
VPGWPAWAWICLALVSLSGCSDVAYYWQAGMGQWEILSKRRSIEEVLADPGVDGDTKAKLEMVLRAQAFGRESLALAEESQFRYYADLGRPFVSWNVVASQAYAIREYAHCFLIVGCLGYRGFFAKPDAEAFAEGLAQEGYDVLVRPVRAYSTLGWFDDPVLNTFLRGGELRLISTIFHEQAHTLLFIKGDTAFNESFATFVEEEGVRRYLAGRGEKGAALLRRYGAWNGDKRRFREIVLTGRRRLETLYASGKAREEMAGEKRRLFEQMREDYQKQKKSFRIASYDGWFDRPLNNAHLVGVQHYRSWVGAFRALFQREGQDFLRFYQAARELSELPRAEREAKLDRLEKETLAHS